MKEYSERQLEGVLQYLKNLAGKQGANSEQRLHAGLFRDNVLHMGQKPNGRFIDRTLTRDEIREISEIN